MDAILLAAGEGSRTGLGFPKQLLVFGGKPLFVYALDLLREIPRMGTIIVAVIPGREDEFRFIAEGFGHTGIRWIPGGRNRQESVSNAISLCTADRVLLHAACRPFVTKEHIQELISYEADAVAPCVSAVYAAVLRDGTFVDRSGLLNIQLPQVFNSEVLKKAHELGKGKNYAEDSELVFSECGVRPLLVPGRAENTKITTRADVICAGLIFEHMGLDGYLKSLK